MDQLIYMPQKWKKNQQNVFNSPNNFTHLIKKLPIFYFYLTWRRWWAPAWALQMGFFCWLEDDKRNTWSGFHIMNLGWCIQRVFAHITSFGDGYIVFDFVKYWFGEGIKQTQALTVQFPFTTRYCTPYKHIRLCL